MRLDTVRVQPVVDMRGGAVLRHLPGMSVLVPAENEASFEIGKTYALSEGRERYQVLILEKHTTSIGVCMFLKQWSPN